MGVTVGYASWFTEGSELCPLCVLDLEVVHAQCVVNKLPAHQSSKLA